MGEILIEERWMISLRYALLVGLFLSACAPESRPAPEAEAEAPHATTSALSKAPAKGNPVGDALPEEMREAARYDVLAPSPEESRIAVEKAGLTTSLSVLVPERAFEFDNISKDQAALRAGVALSDTILTIRERPRDRLSQSLRDLHSGLTRMEAGVGLRESVDELRVKFDSDAISREDLLEELEAIVSMSVPELGFGRGDRTGPLLQAGAWTAGVNLTGRAILKDGKVEQAGTLLRLEKVADYFLEYVADEGKEKAPEPVIVSLKGTLVELKQLSTKETIAENDVQRIVELTDQLLQLI